MENKNKGLKNIQQSLDNILKLLQHSIAIQLYYAGASQDEIAKNLRLAKLTVNKMVKGIKKEKK